MSTEVTQINTPNVPLWVKERLEAEAEKQDRSLASYVRRLLEDHAATLSKAAKPPKRETRAALPVAD